MHTQPRTYSPTAEMMPPGVWRLAIRLTASALVVALGIALFSTLARAEGVLGLGFDGQGGCVVTSDGRGKEPYLAGEQFQGTCFIENHSTAPQPFTLTMSLFQPGGGAELLGRRSGTVPPGGQRHTVDATDGLLPGDTPSGPASIIFAATPSSPEWTSTMHHLIFVAQRGENLGAYPNGIGPPKVRGNVLNDCLRLDGNEPVSADGEFDIGCSIAGERFPAQADKITLTYQVLDSSATWHFLDAPPHEVDRQAGDFSVLNLALPMHHKASSGHARLYVEASWQRPVTETWLDGTRRTSYSTEILDWALVPIHISNPNVPGPVAPTATPTRPLTTSKPTKRRTPSDPSPLNAPAPVMFAEPGCNLQKLDGTVATTFNEHSKKLRVYCWVKNDSGMSASATITPHIDYVYGSSPRVDLSPREIEIGPGEQRSIHISTIKLGASSRGPRRMVFLLSDAGDELSDVSHFQFQVIRPIKTRARWSSSEAVRPVSCAVPSRDTDYVAGEMIRITCNVRNWADDATDGYLTLSASSDSVTSWSTDYPAWPSLPTLTLSGRDFSSHAGPIRIPARTEAQITNFIYLPPQSEHGSNIAIRAYVHSHRPVPARFIPNTLPAPRLLGELDAGLLPHLVSGYPTSKRWGAIEASSHAAVRVAYEGHSGAALLQIRNDNTRPYVFAFDAHGMCKGDDVVDDPWLDAVYAVPANTTIVVRHALELCAAPPTTICVLGITCPRGDAGPTLYVSPDRIGYRVSALLSSGEESSWTGESAAESAINPSSHILTGSVSTEPDTSCFASILGRAVLGEWSGEYNSSCAMIGDLASGFAFGLAGDLRDASTCLQADGCTTGALISAASVGVSVAGAGIVFFISKNPAATAATFTAIRNIFRPALKVVRLANASKKQLDDVARWLKQRWPRIAQPGHQVPNFDDVVEMWQNPQRFSNDAYYKMRKYTENLATCDGTHKNTCKEAGSMLHTINHRFKDGHEIADVAAGSFSTKGIGMPTQVASHTPDLRTVDPQGRTYVDEVRPTSSIYTKPEITERFRTYWKAGVDCVRFVTYETTHTITSVLSRLKGQGQRLNSELGSGRFSAATQYEIVDGEGRVLHGGCKFPR